VTPLEETTYKICTLSLTLDALLVEEDKTVRAFRGREQMTLTWQMSCSVL